MSPAKKTKKTMSAQHKAALASGRESGNAVRRYLEALESNRPKRGRKRTAESMQARLDKVNADIVDASPVKRLSLIQERNDLEKALNATEATVDISGLEADFIAHALAYSESKGISYAAWREMNVPAAVLSAAGITRSGG